MPRIKLTSAAVARLRAPTGTGRPALYWDETLAGFGVLVSGTSARKVYIAQRSVGVGAGAKRRITLGHVDGMTLDAARMAAHEQLAALLHGVDPRAARRAAHVERERAARQNLTLAEACTAFFEQRTGVSAHIRYRWPQQLAYYVPDLLPMRLRDIDAALLAERQPAIAAGVARRARGKARSAAFVTPPGTGIASITMRIVRTIYNHHAQRLGWPKLSLYSEPQRGRITRRRRAVASTDMAAFWSAVDALPIQRDATLIKLLLFTGLRKDEAAGLRWADIRFADGKIVVPAERTKSRRELHLPLTAPLLAVLMQWRATERLVAGAFIFPATRRRVRADGTVLGYASDLTNAFNAIAASTGLVLSPHDLRRTFASVAASCDVPMLALKTLLNHSTSNDVTLGYVIVEWKQLRVEAEQIAARIAELCELPALPDEVAKLPLR